MLLKGKIHECENVIAVNRVSLYCLSRRNILSYL